MKKHYDFSNAERGKFYRDGAVLRLPIYLDSKNPILESVRKAREEVLAESGGTLSALVARLQRDEKASGRVFRRLPKRERSDEAPSSADSLG